jgi:hypothetical protein
MYTGSLQLQTLQYTKSNHPTEQNLAAYRFQINRMHQLPLTANRKQQETKIILQIAQTNGFPLDMIHHLNKKQNSNSHIQPIRKIIHLIPVPPLHTIALSKKITYAKTRISRYHFAHPIQLTTKQTKRTSLITKQWYLQHQMSYL